MSLLSFFKKLIAPRSGPAASRGFTLVEMVTVAAIFTIMTGVLLGNLPAFRSRSGLELVAQEVALVIRQAQAFGSVTRAALIEDETTFPSYGIYLNVGDGGAEDYSTTGFIFFSDRPENDDDQSSGNLLYDWNGGCDDPESECREVFRLTGGIELDPDQLLLCRAVDDAVDDCEEPLPLLHIIFRRPNPEAIFTDGQGDNPCPTCSYARMRLKTNQDQCANIYVWTTGHIYSEMTSCS